MYEPHSILWFVVAFLACVLVSAVGAVLRGRPGLKAVPAKLFIPVVAAIIFLTGGMAIRGWDVRRLRTEFQSLDPALVSSIRLEQHSRSLTLTNSIKISKLLGMAQRLMPVPAHHSFPLPPLTISFQLGQGRYQYEIGRDSQRETEFWVHWLGPNPDSSTAIEIGRFESLDFDRFVDEFFNEVK